MEDLRETAAWKALQEHYIDIRDVHMRDLFTQDARRFEKFHCQFNDMLVDFSKNRIVDKTLELLIELAEKRGFNERRAAMFSGVSINTTEGRPALHAALRMPADQVLKVKGENVIPAVYEVLDKMREFSDGIRSGRICGHTGKRFTDVVNIGIGGSDLGPKMVVEALKPFSDRNMKMHFVSNVDAAHIAETLRVCSPETTLFIVASKTFTTQETMTNAHTARSWFLDSGAKEADVTRHFVALSTNQAAVEAFGIDPANVFIFWDWVGGRYSLWSAIGMAICISIGFDRFRELLDGGHAMDQHFLTEPIRTNIPALLALLDIWYGNFWGAESRAILPYSQYLELLPAYMQQADMESNGKSSQRDGRRVQWQTGSIVWGSAGTNGQHAFYQLLHQGTQLIPCDFIGFAHSNNALGDHHEKLSANFFAQPEALMEGRTMDDVIREAAGNPMDSEGLESILPHKVFDGNRPSTSILCKALTPSMLGSLIAMYEHRIFSASIIWDINAFDQWGVELGKQLAKKILPQLADKNLLAKHDASTTNLIAKWHQMREV